MGRAGAVVPSQHDLLLLLVEVVVMVVVMAAQTSLSGLVERHGGQGHTETPLLMSRDDRSAECKSPLSVDRLFVPLTVTLCTWCAER